MFGWNSAENFTNRIDRIDRIECAQRLPNGSMVIDEIENNSPNGSTFTDSNSGIL